jgi:hypothetical protein
VAVVGIAIAGANSSIAVHLLVDSLSNELLHTLLWFYAGLIVSAKRSDENRRLGESAWLGRQAYS